MASDSSRSTQAPRREDMPYRANVGAVVFNRDGLVWIGHRKVEGEVKAGPDEPMLWQFPQGGLDDGEEPEEGARRELREETGITSVSLLGRTADWLTYDLPEEVLGKALKGKYRGQKQLWFAYRFEGEDGEIAIDPPPGGHAAEFDAWQWKPLADVPALIVPFKRGVYDAIADEFAPYAVSA